MSLRFNFFVAFHLVLIVRTLHRTTFHLIEVCFNSRLIFDCCITLLLSHKLQLFQLLPFTVVYSWFSELRESGLNDACSCQGRWRFKLLRKFGLLPLRTSAPLPLQTTAPSNHYPFRPVPFWTSELSPKNKLILVILNNHV